MPLLRDKLPEASCFHAVRACMHGKSLWTRYLLYGDGISPHLQLLSTWDTDELNRFRDQRWQEDQMCAKSASENDIFWTTWSNFYFTRFTTFIYLVFMMIYHYYRQHL